MFVRLAMDDEADIFVELARMNVQEVRPQWGFDPDFLRQSFWGYLENADPTIYFADQDGEVVGYMMTSVGQFRHVDLQFLIQEVIYVRPEFRGTRAAALLTKHLIAEAERQGFQEILGGNDFGFKPERTRHFLERYGFEVAGYCMRRQIV